MTTPGIAGMLAQREIAALAALIRACRHTVQAQPWDEAGIAAEIRRHLHVPLPELAIALIRAATDVANETPAALSQTGNRAWDDDRPWRCRRHPEHRTRRPNGECSGCYVDRTGVDEPLPIRDRGGKSPGADLARQLRAAFYRPATQAEATGGGSDG